MYKGKDLVTANSIFKGTIGIGNILGLFIGTILHIFGGYPLPFISYGLLFVVMAPVTFFMIPRQLK